MEKRTEQSDDENPLIKPKRRSSPGLRPALEKLLRARSRLIVVLWTLPVYMVAVWVLLANRQSIDSFMFIYMAMWAGFGVDMASRRCPSCGEQFFVKAIFLNLLTRRCVHCRLDRAATKPADEGTVKF